MRRNRRNHSELKRDQRAPGISGHLEQNPLQTAVDWLSRRIVGGRVGLMTRLYTICGSCAARLSHRAGAAGRGRWAHKQLERFHIERKRSCFFDAASRGPLTGNSQVQNAPGPFTSTNGHERRWRAIVEAAWRPSAEPDMLSGGRERRNLARRPLCAIPQQAGLWGAPSTNGKKTNEIDRKWRRRSPTYI